MVSISLLAQSFKEDNNYLDFKLLKFKYIWSIIYLCLVKASWADRQIK